MESMPHTRGLALRIEAEKALAGYTGAFYRRRLAK